MAESGGGEQTAGAAPATTGALRSRSGAPHVFISYASADSTVAELICGALEREGVTCWIAPRDVIPGEFYAGAIVHAIDAAKVIVLVLSENAATSHHVLREVERASSKRHPVVSFRIDRAPMPADLEYFLNTSHWLDARATGVDRALPKLVDAVHRAVTAASASDPDYAGSPVGAAVPLVPPPSGANKAGKSTKIPDIAHELGVAHVLEGSIRRSGNRIRVTAQLIRADNEYHLWSETYDRDLREGSTRCLQVQLVRLKVLRATRFSRQGTTHKSNLQRRTVAHETASNATFLLRCRSSGLTADARLLYWNGNAHLRTKTASRSGGIRGLAGARGRV